MVGLIARPVGGVVDFASTTFDAVQRWAERSIDGISSVLSNCCRTAQSEEVVRRVRYPRHVREDGVVRPYVPHEATGFYLLNVTGSLSLLLPLEIVSVLLANLWWWDGEIRNLRCAHRLFGRSIFLVDRHVNVRFSIQLSSVFGNHSSFDLSRCLVFVSEMSFLGSYEVDWMIEYTELSEIPSIRPQSTDLQIYTKVSRATRKRSSCWEDENIHPCLGQDSNISSVEGKESHCSERLAGHRSCEKAECFLHLLLRSGFFSLIWSFRRLKDWSDSFSLVSNDFVSLV